MKKLCLAGAVAVLLIGTTAYGFAQSNDSSQKMSPGHEMHKRGGTSGTSGYAPSHRDPDDRGTLRDREDRMMNHDRDESALARFGLGEIEALKGASCPLTTRFNFFSKRDDLRIAIRCRPRAA